jgi:exosome complex RNA-binding protein Rrp4
MGVDHPNAFIGGDGIAVGQNGVIYVDTNTGNTFTTVSAILSVSPNGTVGVVWKS